MSFAIQNEISNIQISPSNASTSVATRIIFSEIRTIYHGHIFAKSKHFKSTTVISTAFRTVSVSQ